MWLPPPLQALSLRVLPHPGQRAVARKASRDRAPYCRKKASSRANTFTPHVGQKLASFQRPASEERRQLLNAPSTFTAASGKNAEYENALPVARWHSRHAHA